MTSLKELSGRRILVPGITGILGRSLDRYLSSSNSVLGFSRTGAEGARICDLAHFESLAALMKSEKPDLVINAAAFSNVDACELDPPLARMANAAGVKNLASLCCSMKIPLVHVSTDYVFDGQKKTPYVETDTTAPTNIYGLTKLEGEYHAAHSGAAAAIVRTSWLFGAGNSANFVNAITARLKSEKAVGVLDDQTDAPTYVEDLTRALCMIGQRLLERPAPAAETYHVCNSGQTTRYEMAVAIKEILDLPVEVSVTDRSTIKGRVAVRAPYLVMSNRKFSDAFSMPLRPWRDSLREYLLN